MGDRRDSRLGEEQDSSVREGFLSDCCDNNLAAVVRRLHQGADVNWRDEDGMSALHWAAVNNYGDLLSLLLGQTKAGWSTLIGPALTRLISDWLR